MRLVGWLVGSVWLFFIAYQPFVGYLMPNPFLNKLSVLFQTIQFNLSTKFNCQVIQSSQTVLIQKNQFSVSTVSMSKTSISSNSV